MLAVAVAVEGSRHIMIADDISGPAAGGFGERDLFAEIGSGKFINRTEHEIHRELDFIVMSAVVLLQLGGAVGVGLAYQNGIAFVGNASQAAENVVIFRQLVIVFVLHIRVAHFIFPGQNRIVVQLRVLE